MTHRTAPPTRRLVAALIAVLTALGLVAAPPLDGTAHALPIHCGEGFTGVDGNYAAGRANGHPSTEARADGLDGWGGRDAVLGMQRAVFALERTDEILDATISGLDTFIDTVPTKAVQLASVITRAVGHVVIQALEFSILSASQLNEDVDACSGALIGDFVDVMFVTTLEEDLAALDLDGTGATDESGTAPGARAAPSAMFVLPQDGWPAWHDESHLYTDLEGHPNADIYYTDGALNGPHMGVAVTVRNQIAYLEASGIDTGDTTTSTGPDGQQVTVYGAGDLWLQAMQLMVDGRLDEAYVKFAEAYQRAVTATPPPGIPTTTSSPDPTSPWG